MLPLLFRGRNVASLHALLHEPLRCSTPVPLYISGYGAEAVKLPHADSPKMAVDFALERVSLKALIPKGSERGAQPTNEAQDACITWFDCNRDGPVKLVQRVSSTAEGDVLRPSTPQSLSSDSWLWTPEPASKGGAEQIGSAAANDTPVRPRSERHDALPLGSGPAPLGGRDRADPALSAYPPFDELHEGTTCNAMGIACFDAETREPGGRSRGTSALCGCADSQTTW